MKKLLLGLSVLLNASIAFGQSCIYHEDMELIDSISSNNLTSTGLPGWNANTTFAHDGVQSYHGTFGQGDTAIATSDLIDLTGNTFVILSFWHICKLEFFDQGLIQVSNDGGNTWTNLTGAQYLGTSNFPNQGNKFTEAAYPAWIPGVDTMPQASWWQYEQFDISSLVANIPNAKIRFFARDLNNNGLNRYGWLLDEICVLAAPCELTPPGLVFTSPFYSGSVYNNGPYTYNVKVGDNSGVASVYLVTSLNGAPPDTFAMTNPIIGDSLWTVTPVDTFNVGDTICYYFFAYDASACANSGSTIINCFTVSDGAHLTYCDNFDTGILWTDSLVSGSSWQLGTPAFGQTTGAHSPPNAWDIDLNAGYVGSTESYLLSPIFDFSTAINAKINMWLNYNSEASWDGTRLDYTTDGTTWQMVGSFADPNATNWYNYQIVNSSGQSGWSGSSGGWQNSTRDLVELDFIYNPNPVQFRFVFTSDAIINQDGVSIDDFCIKLPQPQDIGVATVFLPNALYPAGALADVKLLIKNYGLNSATNFDVYYVYNGVTSIATNYPGTLAAGAADTVNCPQFTVLGGTYQFCAYTDLTGDGDNFNDTMCLNVSGIQQVSITYCNDFDVNGGDWTPIPSPTGNTTWELGTPNYGLTNSPHTPPNSWDINLNFNYDFGAETYLLSPIFDFSVACNARMEFWQNRNIQTFYDGARIDLAANGGSWGPLGTVGDTLATNWYNNAAVFSSGQVGWDGTSNGWIKCTYNMNAYNSIGLIQLRFAFNSSTFTTGDGISIDDFCMINPPAEDIGVDAILNPTPIWGAGQLSDVNVEVRNYGCNPISNFDVYYTVNAGAPIGPTTYSGTPIGPNQTVIITCAQFIVPSGNYDFCAYTVLATDGDNSNDTTCTTPKGIPVVPVTYCNDFDTSGADWTAIASPTGNSLWELGTPNYGLTNSAHTPPNAWDVNLTTNYDFGSETYLLSPIFDFATACNARMQFWQNVSTQQFYDGGRMDININGLGWNVLGTMGDTNATNWYTNAGLFSTNLPGWDGNSQGWIKSTYSMNGYNAIGLVQIRFAFNSTNFTTGDGMSIDDFCMINPPNDDVGVDAIIEPVQNWGAGQQSNVTIRVRNFGCNPITNFDVYYTYTGGPGPIGPVTYSGTPILPNGIVDISCATFIVPSGIYDFCGYTVLATDGDNTNDTLCVPRKGVPVDTLNYCENFDGASANDWTPVTNVLGSAWELGTPAYGTTSGAHSAPNAWDINLTTIYQPNANAELLSPFFDMTTAVNAQLAFWQNRNCETNWDGTRIDYTVNGSAWAVLGYQGDPLGTNWYTNNALISSGQPGWDGNSAGWVKSEYVMSAFDSSGLLQLRYVFTSDGSVQYDGFSIDDLCLRIPPPQDAGCNGIVSPTGGLIVGNIYFPTFDIKNFGSANMDSIPVTYTINGASPVTEYYYALIAPNNSGIITFTQGFAAPAGGFNLCMYTGLPGDGDSFNDSCCVTLVGIPTLIPTYTDDFDSINNGWTTTNSNPQSIWELGDPAFGSTTGSHSAPNCWDVNLFSSYQGQANCELISPYFDFTNVINAEISFWINYNTETNWDGTRVDYSSDGGTTFSTLGGPGCIGCVNWYTNPALISSGKPGWDGSSGGWMFAKDSDLSFLNGNPSAVVFKFIFTSDFSVNVDGASVDDFTLYKPITLTAGTNDVYPLNNILTPGPQYIVGRYRNNGTTPLNDVVLTLNIDNNTFVVTDTINPIPGGPLNYNKDTVHTFSIPWNASPGQHLLCIYTSYPNQGPDLDYTDDTTCTYLVVFDSTSAYPYCNGFETGPQWVALNSVTYTPNSSWQIGTPAKVNLIGAHTGAKCWVTNLVNDYPDEDESSLFSPVFNVKTNTCYELRFWQNFDMDLFNDGGTIEYSIDSALTWQQFGQGGDQTNWMNATYIAAFGGPPVHAGWTGYTGGWVESYHNFESIQNGTVIFRWRFASDQSNTADGWAIDDVCFKEVASPCVTSVGEPLAEGFYLYQNVPNPASDVTKIKFSLPASGKAELKVTNVMGQVVDIPVNNVVTSAGMHTVDLNARNLSPGIYYYSLKYDDKTITRRMVITK
ncbi:MAG: T9SS type A sorting domain-containing protein [Bacteroidia bacterium]